LAADEIDKAFEQKGASGQSYGSLAAYSESVNRRVRLMRRRAALEQIAGSMGGQVRSR
jgi:hypothetical protein